MAENEGRIVLLGSLARPGHLRGLALTISGAVLISFEGLLIRLVEADIWTVVWWRGVLLAATLALPTALLIRRLRLRAVFHRAGILAILAFAAAVFCFVSAIQYTSVANTLVIASGTPLAAGLLSWVFLRERPAPSTWLAVIVTFFGLAIIFSGSLQSGHVVGDAFALGYAVCAAGYYTALRRCPEDAFMALVLLGGVLSAILAWPAADPLAITAGDLQFLLLLGIVVVPLATLLLSYGTRDLSAPEVTLLMMLETVLGPLWAWLALAEAPGVTTVAGGVLVAGVAVAYSFRIAASSKRG